MNRPRLPSPKCFARLLAISIIALTTAGMAQAATGDRPAFRFNISPNGYPPYLIVDGAKPSGIMWEVINTIVPRLGYKVMPRKIPRKRVDQMLADDYLDGTPRAVEWTENPENYLFTDAVVNVEEVFFFPKDSGLDFEHPTDLFGKTVVAHLGYLYPTLEPYFADGKIKRFDVSRDRDMFRFVLLGEQFDAALADKLAGQWILRNEGLSDQFRSSTEGISQYGFRLMLRKDWSDFAEDFNRELAVMRDNGELDAILANYR
ncbi:ABC transporter substrate-binding protein [Marinobacter sp. SS5-14b]|uniref:substrate-binding periplasmic protein n=1 Tax=Marinobacter sp. SS5-14b TaxID=3050456 RepID=UPI0026E0165B|nr:transporter substrate-binding domain-containing protein [Marinobacter sp. SS5-14b]